MSVQPNLFNSINSGMYCVIGTKNNVSTSSPNRRRLRLARAPVHAGHARTYALPRMRFMFVPHSGHVPLSIRRPLVVASCGLFITRLVLHLTQYASWDAVLGGGTAAVWTGVSGDAGGVMSAFFRAAMEHSPRGTPGRLPLRGASMLIHIGGEDADTSTPYLPGLLYPM